MFGLSEVEKGVAIAEIRRIGDECQEKGLTKESFDCDVAFFDTIVEGPMYVDWEKVEAAKARLGEMVNEVERAVGV